VHHCGLSADGQYVHTLQLLDVATGWSECVAVLGRSYLVMRDGFARLLRRLPFEIRNYTPTMARNSSTPTWYATGGTR